jgi:hypothetical protein
MVHKMVIPQQSWADGVTTARVPTLAIHGRCEQIVVEVNDNTGNATLTLTITNADGATIYTKAGIPENAKTVYQANPIGSTDVDFISFLADEICTFTMTPSGDPGASGMTADVAVYMRD